MSTNKNSFFLFTPLLFLFSNFFFQVSQFFWQDSFFADFTPLLTSQSSQNSSFCANFHFLGGHLSTICHLAKRRSSQIKLDRKQFSNFFDQLSMIQKPFNLKSVIKKMKNKVFVSLYWHFFEPFLFNWFQIKRFSKHFLLIRKNSKNTTKWQNWSRLWKPFVV